jgi:hypothetical protein
VLRDGSAREAQTDTTVAFWPVTRRALGGEQGCAGRPERLDLLFVGFVNRVLGGAIVERLLRGIEPALRCFALLDRRCLPGGERLVLAVEIVDLRPLRNRTNRGGNHDDNGDRDEQGDLDGTCIRFG